MASKDLALDLVDKLDMLKKNGTDFLLICMEPGKNADRADIWYELRDPGSPANLLESCLSLFTALYDKDDLQDLLYDYCQHLDELNEEILPEYIKNPPELPTKKKSKNKKLPPNDPQNSGETI